MEPGVVERPLAEPARPASTVTAQAPASGLVFVLSGPSGVGKSTLIEALKRDNFPITHCVTATTRPRRPGEVHGVHYFFLTEADYDARLAADEFLEHARRPQPLPLRHSARHACAAACAPGKDLIMAPDVQGARTVRQKLPNAITIFLLPPSLDQLPPRLAARGTESPEERRIRFETAKQEIQLVNEFDYVVINHQDRLPEALDDLKAIITAERLRVNPRVVSVPDDGDR